jgi:arylsulfatase A-like enzyme
MQLTDSTLVFFSSDNGPEGDGDKGPGRGLAGGLRGRKRSMYEGGHRVPGLVRWPGKIQPGTESGVPVIGSDVFPTMLAAAGIEPPAGRKLDGTSIRDDGSPPRVYGRGGSRGPGLVADGTAQWPQEQSPGDPQGEPKGRRVARGLGVTLRRTVAMVMLHSRPR